MKKILDYLKIAVLIIAVLAGVQVPAFVDQYGKNLSSRLSESENSVGEFQDDADKYFGGDMNKLIEHYENKGDPVIVSGGDSLRAITFRNKLLEIAQTEYSNSAYSSYIHVFFNPVTEVRSDTWAKFTYSVAFNKAAIISAVIFGVAALMIFELLIFLLGLSIKALNKSKL